MKVLIAYHHSFEPWCAPAWMGERLEREFAPLISPLKVTQIASDDRLAEEIQDSDALIGWSITPEQLAAARHLKWIHTPAAAVHQLLIPELVASPVVVTNSRDVHGPVVAEHALALLLALAKRLPQAARYQRKKEWAQQMLWDERPRPREVCDAAVLVVGMGQIGREFASRARAMGMRVLAVRENPGKDVPGVDALYSPAQIDEALPLADYVVLCAPVTPSTLQLMNRARLSRMKPEACLINVGRGELVDESALLEALRNRKIGGAALDVCRQEPLPSDSPLWTAENLLITPHMAAAIDGLWQRHYDLIRENLARFLSGRPLLNQVNKRNGY